MAVHPLGAAASASPASSPARSRHTASPVVPSVPYSALDPASGQRVLLAGGQFFDKAGTLRHVPADTRTRRNHGVFLFGAEVAAVYSTRRASDGHGVSMTVGHGSLMLTGSLTPKQARMMARALDAAADAAAAVQEGGAA